MDPFFYINEIFDIKKKELEEMYAFDISAAKAASAAKADKGISLCLLRRYCVRSILPRP